MADNRNLRRPETNGPGGRNIWIWLIAAVFVALLIIFLLRGAGGNYSASPRGQGANAPAQPGPKGGQVAAQQQQGNTALGPAAEVTNNAPVGSVETLANTPGDKSVYVGRPAQFMDVKVLQKVNENMFWVGSDEHKVLVMNDNAGQPVKEGDIVTITGTVRSAADNNDAKNALGANAAGAVGGDNAVQVYVHADQVKKGTPKATGANEEKQQ
jgi:hypothetical protein